MVYKTISQIFKRVACLNANVKLLRFQYHAEDVVIELCVSVLVNLASYVDIRFGDRPVALNV